MSVRQLIVNADDFGRSASVNAGVIHAHEHGIVTSATVMIRHPAAAEAAAYARRTPSLSVGLHIDLAEFWFTDGAWEPRYQRVDTDDAAAVAAEVAEQIERFVELVGVVPSHLDSHQHVHRSNPVRDVVIDAGKRLAISVRDTTPDVRYCGDFYGQDGRGRPLPYAISPGALVRILQTLPPGVTELGCHPAIGFVDDQYAAERETETRTLCDPVVRGTIDRLGIRLCSFHQLSR